MASQPASTPQSYSFKRLVVCCDGTWQNSNQGNRSVPSNVAKISRSIQSAGKDDQGRKCPQLVYYDAGVGTAMGSVDHLKSGAFGEGLSENVCEAYNFLVNNFEDGDEIYTFGFSRGAYTVRALAGLVSTVGICTNRMMDQFWEMYEAYCSKTPDTRMENTAWGQSQKPAGTFDILQGKVVEWPGKGHGKEWLESCSKNFTIEVVGVFDTVGALGWPDTDLVNLTCLNQKYGFYDTQIHGKVKNAFHALAIDEKRRPFSPTLWYLPEDPKSKGVNASSTNLVQCWFPGVHINVGGGNDDGLKNTRDTQGDLESMANITFAWMVDRVREVSSLTFNTANIMDVMDRYVEGLQTLLNREGSKKDTRLQDLLSCKTSQPGTSSPEVYRGWGVGPINDTQDPATQLITGIRVRTPGQYHRIDANGKPEELPVSKTREYIHPVTYHAMFSPYGPSAHSPNSKKYSPAALSNFSRVSLPNALDYIYWEKHITRPSFLELADLLVRSPQDIDPFAPRTIQIPEFVIPDEDAFGGFESLERALVTARPLLENQQQAGKVLTGDEEKQLEKLQKDADQARLFLADLDRQNGMK